MGYRTIWIYPWDLLDEGPDRVARQIADAGLDALSCAVKYHSVEHLRTRGKGPRFASATAALYFRPQRRFYEKSRIKPIVSPLCQDGDPLKEICSSAERVGLRVIAWTVFLHDSSLGRTHPEACMVSAFGDVYTSNLCPANPVVRQFVCSLVQDLSRYPLTAIECESLHYGGVGHYHGHEKIGVPMDPAFSTLLGLCFCRSCQLEARKRGLFLAPLRSLVQKAVLGYLSGDDRGAPTRALREPDLRAFFEIRIQIVSDLVAEARQVSQVPFSFILMGSPQDIGATVPSLRRSVDRFEILAYSADANWVAEVSHRLMKQVGDGEKGVVGLQSYHPASPDRKTLVRCAREVGMVGIRNVSLYHYGIMPPYCLDWVRDAASAHRRLVGE